MKKELKEPGVLQNNIFQNYLKNPGSRLVFILYTYMEMERSDDRDKLATDDDVNVLSGDNKVDVDITPDLQNIRVQICSCSIIFNCFSKQ